MYQFLTALRAFHSCHTHTTLITNILNHDRSPYVPTSSYFIQLGT
ncbi:hypothetical protein MGWOODY_XGa2235 [hydrothermal vent metagenome]|uniref:Uncharacterized protein n=1 Tax=hydrothermal vent metagenome TaxID=652676 RepID=A0A160TXB4_9ZZZZ